MKTTIKPSTTDETAIIITRQPANTGVPMPAYKTASGRPMRMRYARKNFLNIVFLSSWLVVFMLFFMLTTMSSSLKFGNLAFVHSSGVHERLTCSPSTRHRFQ